MSPLIYPEPTWSNRFGRVVRTLQIVAVAGAIGAVGGGVAVMALVGGGSSSRPPTALNVSTADHANINAAAKGAAPPARVAPLAAQPDPAAGAAQGPPAAAPVAVAASDAGAEQQSPAAAEPASNIAGVEQHPVQQAAVPVNSSAGTHLYNRVEPEQKAAPADTPRARAKVTRRIKNAEYGRGERGAPYPADRDIRYSAQRGVPYPDQRGGPYSGERYSYRNYDPPPVVRAPPAAPRGYYFGGGSVFYDRGGWGN
jgi:hypothetical protein